MLVDDFMHLHLEKEEKIFIGLVALFLTAIATVGWFLLGSVFGAILIVFIAALSLGFLMVLNEKFLQFDQNRQEDYRQIESLSSLLSLIDLKAPLPFTRGSAASPDFLNVIISEIFERKPMKILELGSGVSTIVSAYALKNLGRGFLISLDHDSKYASISQSNLEKHYLQDTAMVVYAPLKEIKIWDNKYLWYDTESLSEIDTIDMLIIDGPPAIEGGMSRYPALPLLFERLGDNAVILLDDGRREGEKKAIELWIKEYDCLSSEYVLTEKGTWIIRKVNAPISTTFNIS